MTSAGLALSPTERVPPSKGTPVKDANVVLIDRHPGRSAQTIGIARELGTDLTLIHEPSVGVVGT
jgi:dihydroxy-acid dehydratase